jgi:3'(2'), 5'-bisphosphate nucleotidase
MAAEKAAAVVARFSPSALDVKMKSPGDPVTAADLAADRIITADLRSAFPDDAIVSEEQQARSGASESRVWFVDPIDGTRELVAGTGDHCTMIGLCIDGRPRLGVIHSGGVVYVGIVGAGAWRGWGRSAVAISVSEAKVCSTVLTSRAHRHPAMGEIVKALACAERRLGSVGKKCVLLATGTADAYVEPCDHTHAWDTCAPQALLEAAGGRLTDLCGGSLVHVGREAHARGLLGTNGHCHGMVVAAVSRFVK